MYHKSDSLFIKIKQVSIDNMNNYETQGGAIYVSDSSYRVSISNSKFSHCSSSKNGMAHSEFDVNGGTIFVTSACSSLSSVLITYSRGTNRGQSIALVCLRNECIDLNCTCDVGCQTIEGMVNDISLLLSTANVSIRDFNTTDSTNYCKDRGTYHIGNWPNAVSISFVSVSNTTAGFSFSVSDGAGVSVSNLFFKHIHDTPLIFGSFNEIDVKNLFVSNVSGNLYLSCNDNGKLNLFDSYIGSLRVDRSIVKTSNVTEKEIEKIPPICPLIKKNAQSYAVSELKCRALIPAFFTLN